MSTNCIRCISAQRTGTDLLCDACRATPVVSITQKPRPHPFYGDSYERGLDPWHKDAFPDDLKGAAPNQSVARGSGWFLLDGWGNAIGFVPDGTPIDDSKMHEPQILIVAKPQREE